MKKEEQRQDEQALTFQEFDILHTLVDEPYVNQRMLSESSGHSLGVVNRSLRTLTERGYLNDHGQLTALSRELLKARAPRNAVILAAGFGMRMVPINLSTPKALLEVNGERLIDRLITQLHEAGINDVTVVVGFMKDSFEYLIDEYGVELVFNPDFASANNIRSLGMVADRLSNTYIVPCDIWCEKNPFRPHELYSWYMVSDQIDEESTVKVNRKQELVTHTPGNRMIGISYLLGADAERVRDRIRALIDGGKHDDFFWEAALYSKDRMTVQARVVPGTEVYEINTYEQLRDLDSNSNQLRSDAITAIAKALRCSESDVREISVLKKGMTNRSFLFIVDGAKYIMRIPGEGTDQLIDRAHEAEVFRTISGLGLCDDPVYIDPSNGYKITKYLEGIRVCDTENQEDLKKCMEMLRRFHSLHLTVPHSFDVFGQIEFYESLWDGAPSVYRDYARTKENVFSLRSFIDGLEKDWCLTHIDAVCDNFLFYTPEGEREEKLQLTDWEYSGMQDPHVDIAMFCIYSLYNKRQCDRLIDIYFEGNCDRTTRAKIYCYIAACGLLWSNWCEFKRKLGVEFGEYSLRQYRYAKDYYRYARELMEEAHTAQKNGGTNHEQ